ncbi:MAG: helix-turn-helix domain-containing protein [Lachnospiraceae bacterium]|nr:helix-turn-helix domain-containing protein [Lachnospiraceae bacterium]MBQ2115069.1 helix-turn-helix domain-containing protein [Lachnospiraceae bacterium]MBQ2407295.1 helix-turn-helix domain-containing protein [Lachnospiraceae bacterium]MEE0919485.1 helix-turn-helix domain-containing protein [Lachnospiraceae bacterium]
MKSIIVSKSTVDKLLEGVIENDKIKIHDSVWAIYDELFVEDMDAEFIRMNMDYLLMQLAYMAMEQDNTVNQYEIIQRIRKNSINDESENSKRELFEKTVVDFADYLCHLRSNNSQKVVVQIENYVKSNYSQNISLKEMGQKFYINSAYLGQIFRKAYGISFREYLNKCRIDKASELLIKTDDMVYEIAETVGYNDADYFVNKFIAMKGCSPTTYRKRTRAYN